MCLFDVCLFDVTRLNDTPDTISISQAGRNNSIYSLSPTLSFFCFFPPPPSSLTQVMQTPHQPMLQQALLAHNVVGEQQGQALFSQAERR